MLSHELIGQLVIWKSMNSVVMTFCSTAYNIAYVGVYGR